MTTLRFDSLAYANRLKKVGMDAKIAECLAEEQANVINTDLVTKIDLNGLNNSLLIEMKLLRQDFTIHSERLVKLISKTETRMYKYIFGMFVSFGVIQHFLK